MDEETKSFLICFCQMARMGCFQISPQISQFIFCSYSPSCRPESFEWSNGFISWRSLLFSPHLCQPVKQMSDELKLCCCRLPAVLKRAMDVMEGGREINLPFTKSSLVCLLSSGWVKPNWAASYNQEKGQVNKCVCVCVSV